MSAITFAVVQPALLSKFTSVSAHYPGTSSGSNLFYLICLSEISVFPSIRLSDPFQQGPLRMNMDSYYSLREGYFGAFGYPVVDATSASIQNTPLCGHLHIVIFGERAPPR
jgi:hypothetical protein